MACLPVLLVRCDRTGALSTRSGMQAQWPLDHWAPASHSTAAVRVVALHSRHVAALVCLSVSLQTHLTPLTRSLHTPPRALQLPDLDQAQPVGPSRAP